MSTEKRRRRKRRRGASASANARSEGKGGRAMRIGRRSRNPDAYRTVVDESGRIQIFCFFFAVEPCRPVPTYLPTYLRFAGAAWAAWAALAECK